MQLQQAQQRYAAGELEQSKEMFLALSAQQPLAVEPLEFLAMVALQEGSADQAVAYLRQLTELAPGNPLYVDRLASLLTRTGRTEDALSAYRRLLHERPGLIASRFNYASLLRRSNLNEEALAAYKRCLEDGIERPEEVLATIGSLLADLNRDDEALTALNRGLELNPDYAPAHYNLALYYEECGNWPEASHHFKQISEADPLYPRALARLVQGQAITDLQHPLIVRLGAWLERDDLPADTREDLHFALAKALDDAGAYDRAFEQCRKANTLAAQRAPAYQRELEQQRVTDIITCDESGGWSAVAPVSQAPLIFICGMFRSGSTLLEQMLAAHHALVAGGEIDFFGRHLPLAEFVHGVTQERAQATGQAYIDYLDNHFDPALRVVNKRLDTGYYIGMLRRLFPQARFLRTVRHPLDNAISIYFQQLADDFPYANELSDIGHYWLQQERLLDFWANRYPQLITTVRYEDLVSSPRETLVPALNSLELGWDDACLAFHEQPGRVRTASVAQVRKRLYTASAGRWQNYTAPLQSLREQLL